MTLHRERRNLKKSLGKNTIEFSLKRSVWSSAEYANLVDLDKMLMLKNEPTLISRGIDTAEICFLTDRSNPAPWFLGVSRR